jgi:hypothetical protein
MRFTGTTVLKVVNGKIVEEVGLDDGVTALTQLGQAYFHFALERPAHFQVMFDSNVHRNRDPGLATPSRRAFQTLTHAVKNAFGHKDVETEETAVAAIWALMHGLAFFGLDETFKSMAFHTLEHVLVPRRLQMLLNAGTNKT